MQTKKKRKLTHYLCIMVMSTMAVTAWGQAKSVSGTVKDGKGDAVIGASVVIKGSSTGTITDVDGNFNLSIPASAKALVVSYIGMETLEVPITGKPMTITLKESSIALNEVVAIGYGVVKKRDLTGSVASVKADEIAKTSTSNAMQAMQARVPGLDVMQSSGQAGAGVRIQLRGNRSITASNSPLILVDGVEYGSTLDISPSDIESMEVLKDASSTAIYGTRGANGVIIITTKRGKSGATKVSVNSYLSFNSPTNVPKVMYGDKEVQRLVDKANYQADALSGKWGTSNLTPQNVLTESLADFTEYGIYQDKSYTNWLDIIMQNGLTKNVETSVSGGNEKTNFSLSLGGMFDEGLQKNDKQNRYNVKMSIDHKISKYFKTGASILYTYKDNDAASSSVYSQSLKMTSITHPYTADGTLIAAPNPRYAAHCNPLLDQIDGAYANNTESTRFFGSSYLEVTPIKNMVFKSNFAVDRSTSRNGQYIDFESVERYQSPHTSYISLGSNKSTGFTWDNTLNYNTNFGGSKHDLTTLIGQSLNQNVSESLNTYGSCGAEHYYTNLFYDVTKITTPTVKSTYVKQSMLSFFGRLNYKFNDKYLLTASLRADGSSTLADGHKWGYFPSTALAWRMNDESFLKDVKWLSNLKLRTSWGISGNAAVDPYSTLAALGYNPVYYYMGTSSIAGYLPSSLGNKDLKWETTQAYNFGVDFGFLNNRISGSIEYYTSHTSDLLYQKIAPASSVYPSVIANIGETKGHGIEVALNTLVVKNKNFSWDINWSYSSSTDKITKLTDGVTKNINGTIGQIVGQPVKIYYDYKSNGCWNVGEYANFLTDWQSRHQGQTIGYPSGYGTPGTLKLIDSNDDGKFDDNDKYIYNQSPKHIIGMNNNFTYKDFSLSVLVYARLGGYISYGMNSQLNYESANWGDIDYWTPTNVTAKFPSPGAPSAMFASYGSSLMYEKADYVKIKEINLSYSLPKKLLSNVGIERLKIYASLKNFITFSKIDNYDPERGGSIAFPLAKQVVVGLNLDF
ncbi:SusC/RagA family TonB-linked outer membrane protein [Paludibacter jiangxiensis]|nr:TonB-dependent receptor [Paludibacter jiangxiensis]